MKKIFSAAFLFCSLLLNGQGGYQPGNAVGNLLFPSVLNAPAAASSFHQLKGKLTFLDFFGTWCAPCLKAIPVLEKWQRENKNLKVVLISTESEGTLKKFLAERPSFSFPVVVDHQEAITALFQPPSLPYTVVVDENGKVLALTEAAEITDEKIKAWMEGKGEEMKVPELPLNKRTSQPASTIYMQSSNKTVALSQDFVYAAKTGADTKTFVNRLQEMEWENLRSSLATDAEKKAFWINLYNGFTQYFLRQNPDQYKARNRFFKKKQIRVAGRDFSLDDIEHGILRRSKIKWSLGHVNKVFPGKTEKALRVDSLDYRIHFALNCGAKSCPPVAYYTPERLEQQLSLATRSYLSSDVEYHEAMNTIHLPAIMGWFRGDFGGKKGMRHLLRQQGYPNVDASTKIRFKKYDWNLYLDNFKNL